MGLCPCTPQYADGILTLPIVSVPSATSHNPADTATADPPEDPPGVYPTLQGFSVRPKVGLSVVAPKAPSCMFTVPRIIPPEFLILDTAFASFGAIEFLYLAQPAVNGKPFTAMFDFTPQARPSPVSSVKSIKALSSLLNCEILVRYSMQPIT